jgi:hypothetical protein
VHPLVLPAYAAGASAALLALGVLARTPPLSKLRARVFGEPTPLPEEVRPHEHPNGRVFALGGPAIFTFALVKAGAALALLGLALTSLIIGWRAHKQELGDKDLIPRHEFPHVAVALAAVRPVPPPPTRP